MKITYSFLLLFFISCSFHSNHEKQKLGLDAHMHIHSQDIEDDLQFTGSRALFAADSIGLKRAIILSNAYSANVSEEYAKKQNDFVFEEMQKIPQRLAGACAINPATSWALKELSRCHEKGFKVLKLHTMASGLDLKKPDDLSKLSTVLKAAEEKHFTIIIHGHFPVARRGNEAEILLRELEKYPELNTIIGHLLGAEYKHLETFKHPKFWVEISAAPIFIRKDSEKENLVQSMRKVGMKHFIFGSDWPVFHPAETLKALKELPLKESEIDSIMFDNAEALNYLF